MSQRLVTSFINTNIPGAYPNVVVQSSPVGLGSSGILVIMGEADGGPSYSQVTLKNNFFAPSQLAQVQSTYLSGQIVDAFSALTAPSNDANITGTATQVYILKTNTSTQADALVLTDAVSPVTYGTLKDLNYGANGNKYQYQIVSVDAEVAPKVTGNTIPIAYTFTVSSANATAGAVYSNNSHSFTVLQTIAAQTTLICSGTGAPSASGTLTKVSGTGDATITFSAFSSASYYGGLSGSSFNIRVNGGASIVVTLSGTITDVPSLVISLNNAFTAASVSNISASAGTAANTIVLTMSADAHAYANGWGKSFELIDSTPGDLAALGLVAGLTVSSQEPGVELNIVRPDNNTNESFDTIADVVFQLGYQGTTATVSIAAGMLTTTVTGGSGANLSINLANYSTCANLAAFINTQSGYSATAAAAVQQLPPSVLDQISGIGICSTAAGDEPGRLKMAASSFARAANTSTALSFVPSVSAGLPGPMALPVFLAGGARGGTAPTDIVNSLALMAGVNVNIIIPLFSEDASADIALGLTDSSSTYTIDAINALVKDHCIAYSTPTLKKNRIAILSFWDDVYEDAKSQAQSLANYRVSLCLQQVRNVNSLGVITTFMPWMAAVIAAGMQAGGFYKAIVNKLANVISFVDPAGFDSGNPGDVSDALSGGLLFLSQSTAGSYWVSDQTTYGFDTNFVYNSIQAVYDSDLVALDLAQSFQAAFTGQSLADVNATSALSFLAQKMNGYRGLKLIAGSSDAPVGYKNASVSIAGPVMTVSVEIKLATAIYFIPINISISQVQSTAG